MLPLTSYSTFHISGLLSEELNNELTLSKFDEDDKVRYIRKVFHKIRNARKEKRKIDVAMSIYVYIAYNFNLNGYILKRVILQIKQYDYIDIDVSRYEDIDAYNLVSGVVSIGIQFDNKLSLYFDNQDDKQTAINYINGGDNDDFIPAFSHFDEKKIDAEISERLANPRLINQSTTPLCGIAVVASLIAKYYETDFRYLVKDLFFYAEAFFGATNYFIKPRNLLVENNYHINPNEDSYPNGMPQADYVLLTSIKESENKVLSFNGGPWEAGGTTWPNQLSHLLMKMLNAKEVIDKTRFPGMSFDEMQHLADMDADYNSGYECLMLINDGMLNKYSKSGLLPLPTHWVTYQGGAGHS